MSSDDMADWYHGEVLPHKPTFLRIASRVIGDADRAEDVVQDILTDMLSDDRWKIVPRPRTYIIRSIYNRCFDYLRRLKLVPMAQLVDTDDAVLMDESPDALQVLEGRDTMARVIDALEILPAQTKLVFTLSTLGSLSVQDISKRTGTSETLIRRQIKHGRYLLTKAMDERHGMVEAPYRSLASDLD